MDLPGFLTRNWTLKLSAFGIALLLWVSVRVEAPNRQALDGVPIRIDLVDPTWALANAPEPQTVTVRFHGPSRELIRMAVDRPTVVVPIDRVDARDTTVVLRNHFVRVQDRPDVTVDDIEPATVRLAFEPVRRIELPVAIRFEGELPEEWALSTPPVAIPDEVRVSGPESRVLQLDSVRLRPIELGEVQGPSRIMVEVDTTGASGLQILPAQVELDLSLEPRVERRLEGVRVGIQMDGWEEAYEIDPATVTVELSGARSLVERIVPPGLLAVIELDGQDLPEEPGEEVTFPLRLMGVPRLLSGELEVTEVTVRRRDRSVEDPPGSGGGATARDRP